MYFLRATKSLAVKKYNNKCIFLLYFRTLSEELREYFISLVFHISRFSKTKKGLLRAVCI